MPGGDSTADLEATFSLVANDIRLEILRILWDIYTDDPSPDPEPVPFSTLKDRVGIRDSGQFHYHLDELVPQFVTHHEDGYTLTYASAQIVGAAFSGVYTDTEVELDARTIDECAKCEGILELRYEEGHAVVDCDSCDVTRIMSVPPILVDVHDLEGNPELLGTYTRTQLQQTIHGFCYLCSGPVEGTVADASFDREADGVVRVAYECLECGAPFYTTASTVVVDHPAVVSLLHDAGIDYRKIPSWGISRTLNSEERIRDDNPVQVEVTVTVGDDELTLVLDENLNVVTYSRA